MVYSGRPSGACENCRKVHKKCDEKKPECSRCVKTKKSCSGYKDQSGLFFRDETIKAKEKVQQRQKFAHSSVARRSFTQCVSISRPLIPPKEEIAICNFYHSIIDNLSDEDPTLYLHKQLPHLYAKSKIGSVLHLALEAISYVASAKIIPQANQLGIDRYSKAIRIMRERIESEKQNSDDQTVYGVLLLCGYETGTGQLHLPSAWGNHVDGALALMKLQANKPNTPLSHGIFSFIQKNMVMKQMQICQPVDNIFFEGFTSLYKDPESRLISLAIEIPGLQHQSIHLEQLEVIEIERILHDASALGVKLSTWASTVPPSWNFVTALRLNDGTLSQYVPCIIHKYRHHYIARVWNFYRVSQLILQSICLRATVLLPASADDNEIGQKIASLVDDICATVPYLLGTDLCKMKLDFTEKNMKQDPRLICGSSAKSFRDAHVGRFSLIWPLFVACGASRIPQVQKEWMRKQLHLLAENGVPLAQTVCAIESQILLGGPERFVFDCV